MTPRPDSCFLYRSRLTIISCLALGLIVAALFSAFRPTKGEIDKPNIVLIMLDDGGFEDFWPFGNPPYPTPHVQTLAEEGRSFYNFHVPQAVCSASRAALLTGCYPGRTRVFNAYGPENAGLSAKFTTLGEVLQKDGYTTGLFGKWHLGDLEGSRPWERGFDETCGLLYSNDMWKYHPGNPDYWGQWPLQYWENDEVRIDSIDQEDQKMLTTWYTEAAVDFIKRNKEEPFFLYLPHSMPHVPIFCSDKFEGKSGTGLYGDVMMELDWSVGQVNQALKDFGLEENTLFIFIGSDNGPWLSYGHHAGITGYREGKATGFEGGLRNPCIIKYQRAIEGGSGSHKMINSVDILPTICAVTGADLPANVIDGKNLWDIVLDRAGAENPHLYYPFSTGPRLEGVMSGDGKWKLHLSHSYRSLDMAGVDGQPGKYDDLQIDTSLFDLVHDPYEKGNVIHHYPVQRQKMVEWAMEHQKKFYPDQQ